MGEIVERIKTERKEEREKGYRTAEVWVKDKSYAVIEHVAKELEAGRIPDDVQIELIEKSEEFEEGFKECLDKILNLSKKEESA